MRKRRSLLLQHALQQRRRSLLLLLLLLLQEQRRGGSSLRRRHTLHGVLQVLQQRRWQPCLLCLLHVRLVLLQHQLGLQLHGS